MTKQRELGVTENAYAVAQNALAQAASADNRLLLMSISNEIASIEMDITFCRGALERIENPMSGDSEELAPLTSFEVLKIPGGDSI